MKPLVISTTFRGNSEQTKDCITALGFPAICIKGIADIALARNLGMTRALEFALKEEFDCFLFVDDDMTFTPDDAKFILQAALDLNHPVSALYSLVSRESAASLIRNVPLEVPADSPYADALWVHNRWLVGFGFCAVSRTSLLQLSDKSNVAILSEEVGNITEFTWTGSEIEDGRRYWYSEDTRLCNRMGGFILAPVAVGHIKELVLTPDSLSLEKVRQGKSFGSS